ncbi:reverse transcriptase domain-containing protein [Tanacetum coccineum]
MIIIDPDDQPMWESAKTVAPTSNSVIVRPDVDDNFVINSTHLKMILENKFDGQLQVDPHDHIREFLAICNIFKYGETQSEAVKLLIFPFSLCDKAKTWFNELNEDSITSWEQMRKSFINNFFPPSLFNRLLLEIRNFSQNECESLTDAWLRLKDMLQKCHGYVGGIFLYKSPNQAFQFLNDKVLFKLDWSTKSQNEHHQKSVAFANGSDSYRDNSLIMEKLEALTIKIESQFQSLKEEMYEIHKYYNNCEGNQAFKNDNTPMCECHEANYIQYEGNQNQNSHDLFSHQSHHDPNDSEKSLTDFKNDVKNDLEDFKRCVRSMRTIHSKLYEREDQSKTDLEKTITKFLDGQRVANMMSRRMLMI